MIKQLHTNQILKAIVLFSLLLPCIAFSANISSNASGNWNAPGTWIGGVVPGAADDVTIQNGNLVTLTANASCNNITITGAESCLLCLCGCPPSELRLGTYTLSVAASFTNDATFTANTGTVQFTGTGIVDGTGALAFSGLTINSSGTVTLGAAASVSNLLTMTAGTFNAGTNTLNGGGNITATGGDLILSKTGTTLPEITGAYILTEGTISFNGTAAQTIRGGKTYFNVGVGGIGTATLGGATTVNGNLTVNAGIMALSTFNITVAGVTSVTGTMSIASTTGTRIFGDVIINAGGAWNSSVAEDYTINGNIQNDGTFTSGAGTYTLAGAGKTISGTSATGLSIANVAVTGSYTNNIIVAAGFSVTTALSGAGSLTQDAGGALLFLGGTSAITTLTASAGLNEVTYNGAAAQTVKAITYYHLTTTTSTKTLAGNIIVMGDLVISSGTLDVTATPYNIDLAGSWTNSGTFTPRTGTVTLNGTAAQIITKAVGEIFYNLTLSKGSGTVTLSSPVAITNLMTFTNGIITSTAVNLLTINSGAGVASASDASFVSGPVAKVGSTDFTFPVGKDAKYRLIAISSLSGSETFTATYFHFDPNLANAQDPLAPYDVSSKDAALNHIGRCEYWTLNRTSTPVVAFVTLSWDSYSCGVSDITNLAVARWDGTTWKDHGQSSPTGSPDPGTGTIATSALVTAFSPFTLASKNINNPLPVELLAFDANAEEKFVDLKWTTASEINSDYFIVQRSKDGRKFEDVDKVMAMGNSSVIKNYSSMDFDPYEGLSYYRLKQFDKDGKFQFSNIITVNFESQNGISVYPNPSNGKFILNSEIPNAEITIYNLSGEKIYSSKINIENSEINLSNQPSGIYFLNATYENGIANKKIIINK